MSRNSISLFSYSAHKRPLFKAMLAFCVNSFQSVNLFALSVVAVLCWGLSGCNNVVSSTSTPAPWEVQVNTALQAAAKIDKSAKLWTVIAYPTEYKTDHWDYSVSPLELEFTFINGVSGKDVIIRFEDTNMTSTLKAVTKPAPTIPKLPTPVPGSGQAQRQSEPNLRAILKLGPREAGLLTWEDAKAQAIKRGIKVSPGFYIEAIKPSVRWQIGYVASTRGDFEFGHDLLYIVDPNTSQIVERDYEPTNPKFVMP